jgi:tRNASer (uridine44-2'-O)-methyltransferase
MTSGSAVPPRPKCLVRLLDINEEGLPETSPLLAGLNLEEDSIKWTPLGTCLAHFNCSTFLHVLRQHIAHPERNSSSILRADILDEVQEQINGRSYTSKRVIRRLIRPRRPNLDGVLHQTCTIYQKGDGDAIVVYTPQTVDGGPIEADAIPYYHPKVRAIAFTYKSRAPSDSTLQDDLIEGDLYIQVIPFACAADFNANKQRSHRLSRTALALLETISQHSWGYKHNYQKRVIHDTLVSREEYMDLYIALKERHANTVIDRWVESTKAAKHVFEDIGIAAFLILLWKETELATGIKTSSFVDVGCGNGLLVYLLNAEGYQGFGFDLQVRKSWAVWRELPGGADLRLISIDAPAMVEESEDLFPPGSFLIGNHADELTSWIPLLAHAVPECYGFVNIPCCLFQLDSQHFNNSKYTFTEEDLARLLGRGRESSTFAYAWKEFDRGPPRQGVAVSTTRNVTYLKYLSHLHLQAGWHLEKEALRIPSTKNWALIGRRRVWQSPLAAVDDQVDSTIASQLKETVTEWVESMAAKNSLRWKARSPPGKMAASSSH